MTTFSKLSEQMVVQILSRLPPKSLIRFKCVGQLWYTLINNPSFVEKNLSNSIDNKFTSSTYILCKRTILTDNNIMDEKEIRDVMLEYKTDRREILLSLLNICSDNDPDYTVEDYTVPHPMQMCPLSSEIAGHCDGIICLNYSQENIVLCNPAIKEFTFLPESCLLLPPKDLGDYDALESSTNAVGFGYDSKAKDYKVVRVVEFFSETFTRHPTRVEVYTLSANSWREIETNINTWNVMWSPSSKMYFKGTYYWLAYDYDMARKRKEAILSFDMAAELFHNVPIPDVFDDWYKSLAVLKESIVLLSYTAVDTGVPNKSFDIWMMDDFGSVNGSWTKHITIGPLENVAIPLVFWKTNELLMATTDGCIVSYNFGTQKLKNFPIRGMEDPLYIQAVCITNSIVSVKKRREA